MEKLSSIPFPIYSLFGPTGCMYDDHTEFLFKVEILSYAHGFCCGIASEAAPGVTILG